MQNITQNQMLSIFLLALVMRAASLVFNEVYLGFEPIWFSQSRSAIILALSELGRAALPSDVETYYGTSVEQAKLAWPFMDRGLVYVHLILKWVFGQTSYLKLQILQLIIDAFMVFPIAAIGRRLGEDKVVLSSGIFYAIFIPQIWIATMPEYNVWLTYTFIMLTWLMFVLLETCHQKALGQAVMAAISIMVVGFVGAQMRSIAVLAPLGLAGWYWFSQCIQHRTIRIPSSHFKITLAIIFIGIGLVVGSSLVNGLVRGETSPVRSTFGHSFWAGIGQFDNSVGVRDSDSSVAQFYTQETGISDTGNTGGVEYNTWLTNKALEFIKNNPTLYFSMVVRRGLMILFPNMPFTIAADTPAYSLQEIEIERVKNRKALQAQHGRLSPALIFELVKSDPAYVIGLLFRVFLLLAFPLGVFGFLVLSPNRIAGMLALFPLAYVLITLAPFYMTPIVLVPAHAAVIPVIVAGWLLVFEKFNTQIKKLREKYTT